MGRSKSSDALSGRLSASQCGGLAREKAIRLP